jgi:D-aminopeptidase
MSVSTQIVTAALFVFIIACCAEAADSPAAQQPAGGRRRAREMGIVVGVLSPGPLNAITDVAGVRVGHRTLIEGTAVRTGVTAVVPHAGNLFQQKVPAAVVVGNGFGKLVGVTQVEELGVLETPVVLTNTLSTFTAAEALVVHALEQPGNEQVRSVNPVVGECNDGYLNDIRALPVHRDDVLAALAAARTGPVEEGSVGAGTGTRCMGYKGGIGTSSRRLSESHGGYTVGVLAQTNFNGILSVAGAPVGKELGRYLLKDEAERPRAGDDGSCMLVLATDAPLDARQLKRIARRALLGLAGVGSPMTHGSGDYCIAFSTEPSLRTSPAARSATRTAVLLRDEALTPYFQAAREATEEAVLNSLFMATTVTGHRGTAEAIPLDRVEAICRRHGVIGR